MPGVLPAEGVRSQTASINMFLGNAVLPMRYSGVLLRESK